MSAPGRKNRGVSGLGHQHRDGWTEAHGGLPASASPAASQTCMAWPGFCTDSAACAWSSMPSSSPFYRVSVCSPGWPRTQTSPCLCLWSLGSLAALLLGSSVQRGLPKAMSAVGPPPWAAPARLRRDTRSFVRSAASLGSGPRCRAQRGRINALGASPPLTVSALRVTSRRGETPGIPGSPSGHRSPVSPSGAQPGPGSLFPRRVILKPPQPSHTLSQMGKLSLRNVHLSCIRLCGRWHKGRG